MRHKVLRAQEHARVHPLISMINFGDSGLLNFLPKWLRAHFQGLNIPDPSHKSKPVCSNPKLRDGYFWQGEDGHAVWTCRHIQTQCKRLLTEQDRGRDTKRKDTGQGPRAGSLHTIMFPLKMPRRWRVLNWNLEFQVIDESIFVMIRRWSIFYLAFLVWFIILNIQTYGMWASICTPDQESTNVRNKPNHWLSVPPHGLVLRVN